MDILQYKQDARNIPNNFSIRKGIPIDTRFIINSLDTIDTELPLALRYPGLKFFILTYEVKNITGDTVKTGALFKFETDLNVPIYDATFSEIKELIIDLGTEDYSTLNTKLNALTVSSGSIIHILPLDILVILEGTTWKYLYGEYKLPNDAGVLFNTIPNNFKSAGKIIKFTSGIIPYGIIDNSLELVEKVQVLNDLPQSLIENGYYLIRGSLFIVLNGIPYQISQNSLILENQTVVQGITTIKHNLSSANILLFIRINNINNNQDNFNGFSLEIYQTIDENNITIESYFPSLNIDLILIAK